MVRSTVLRCSCAWAKGQRRDPVSVPPPPPPPLVLQMNIILFEDAMAHVCRICRIIQSPPGSALLVGVGGSGKQSLTRLAAYICGFAVHQIQITAFSDLTTFKEDLKPMLLRAGVKGHGVILSCVDTPSPCASSRVHEAMSP